MGRMKNVYRILIGNPVQTRPLGDLILDGRIILKWISEEHDTYV